MLANDFMHYDDPILKQLNADFQNFDSESTKQLRIAVIFLGQQSPGGNNVIDGLLRFKAARKNV